MASKLSIVFQTPPLKGLDIALSKPRITIGRDPNNDIVIDHIEVSRKHAVIEVNDSVVTITDIGSLNGTYVDGKQISMATELMPGQVIEVSEAVRFVLMEEDSPAEKTAMLEPEAIPQTAKVVDSLQPDDRGLDDFEPFYSEEPVEEIPPIFETPTEEGDKSRKTVLLVVALLLGLLILGVVGFIWYIDYFSLWCDILPFLFEPGLCP